MIRNPVSHIADAFLRGAIIPTAKGHRRAYIIDPEERVGFAKIAFEEAVKIVEEQVVAVTTPDVAIRLGDRLRRLVTP